MLRLTKNVALPTLRCFSSRITIDNINQKIRTADYAVRGEVVIRAIEIDAEMKKGKKFPFESLLYCNVGNPQAIQQKPITFLREVLCITSWPEVAEKHPEMFHPDALQRAKELLAATLVVLVLTRTLLVCLRCARMLPSTSRSVTVIPAILRTSS